MTTDGDYELVRGKCHYCKRVTTKVRSVEPYSAEKAVLKLSCLNCQRLLDKTYKNITDTRLTETQ